jgi:hypothetical protein
VSLGPVQLLVLGFNHPAFHGEVIAELDRLRRSDVVRVIDALAVYKDAAGALEVEHLSHLTQDETVEPGSVVGDLVGLDIDGEERPEPDDAPVYPEQDEWDVIDDIPTDSAAALVLLEHRWAVPLRDALARAGGYRISDGFISPLDLVEIGLITAEEARKSEEIESSAS